MIRLHYERPATPGGWLLTYHRRGKGRLAVRALGTADAVEQFRADAARAARQAGHRGALPFRLRALPGGHALLVLNGVRA
jgi:hypothetical protein